MSLILNDMMGENDDDNSDLSEHARFLTKGNDIFIIYRCCRIKYCTVNIYFDQNLGRIYLKCS